MPLTSTEIEMLLHGRSISADWPWCTNDEQVIDGYIEGLVAEMCRTLRLCDRTEYGHYGAGYASFVDCWLYRPDDDFRNRTAKRFNLFRWSASNAYCGLVVLFSRLSAYYVIGQGNRSWTKRKAAAYLPDFTFVDEINRQAVVDLVAPVQTFLLERGLQRLYRSDLDTILPGDLAVPTILATRVFRHFDALFHWQDW
ncbi:MAG: hypothetical protein ACK5PS_19025 [Desulfopila sp.]